MGVSTGPGLKVFMLTPGRGQRVSGRRADRPEKREVNQHVATVSRSVGLRFSVLHLTVETNRKYADFDTVTIANVGPCPMLEKPKEFDDKLRDVLKGLSKK